MTRPILTLVRADRSRRSEQTPLRREFWAAETFGPVLYSVARMTTIFRPRRRFDVFTPLLAIALAAGCGPAATPATTGGYPGLTTTPPSATAIGNTPEPTATAPASDALGWAHATAITVKDGWAGLGCMHTFEATLERKGDRLVGTATLEAGNGSPATRTVEVADGALQTLEDAVVRAAAVPAWEPPPEGEWTDDYPSGSIAFTGPGGTTQLYFQDQHRRLMLEQGGKVVPLRDPPPASADGRPGPIWIAYSAFLDGPLGLRPWITSRCGH